MDGGRAVRLASDALDGRSERTAEDSPRPLGHRPKPGRSPLTHAYSKSYPRRMPHPLVTVADYEALARERLDPGTFDYFAGGAGAEVTLARNLSAFERYALRPRVL